MSTKISLTKKDFLTVYKIDKLKKKYNFNHLLFNNEYINKPQTETDKEFLNCISSLKIVYKTDVNLICLTYSHFTKISPSLLTDDQFIQPQPEALAQPFTLKQFDNLEVDIQYLKSHYTCTYHGWVRNDCHDILKHTYNFNILFNTNIKKLVTNEFGVVPVLVETDDEIKLYSLKLPVCFGVFNITDSKYNVKYLYSPKHNIKLIIKNIS
jgi:hypothetical protein